MKLRKLKFILFLFLQLTLLEAQGIDVKAEAEKDFFRGDVLQGDIKTERNKIWEDVSLSLLVQEVKKEADKSGLESFDLYISNNTINIIYRDIRFLPDSSEVTPETEEKISKLTKILERFSDMVLLVQGHTAKLSPQDTDDGLELSKKRAQSVAGLITKTGIFTSEQIEAVGKGFYEPAADNTTPEGRALNRRVEISIAGSIDQDSDRSMVWWNLLSASKEPGYTAYLVPDTDIETVTAGIDKAGISDLIIASSTAGVGIIDNAISYTKDGTPDPDSIVRIEKIGSILLLIQPDTKVRIGGYGGDRSKSESEERHFLTAYTLGAIAGFKPGTITFSAAPYVLTKATAALKASKIFTIDGTPIELEGDGASFSATVPYSIDSLLIDLTTEDPRAKVTGLSEDAVALVPGTNEILFNVESAARAQKIFQSYHLIVVRQKPEFQSLSISSKDQPISLVPEFSPAIKEYRAEVPYEVTDLEVVSSLLPEDEAAGAVAIVEKEYTDTLNPGPNRISVTLSDGSSPADTYTISIVRQESALTTLKELAVTAGDGEVLVLSPPFSPEIAKYTVSVPYSVSSVSLKPVPTDADSRIEKELAEVRLSVGNNEITTVVTDQTGENPREYHLTIQRSAPLLSGLEIEPKGGKKEITLVPEFSPEIKEYRAEVPYEVTDLEVVTSLLPEDEAAGAVAAVDKDYTDSLNTGPNRISVTLSDGSTVADSYTIAIVRQEPALTTLKELTVTAADGKALVLSPSFSSDITEYTVSVPYSVSSVSVNPIPMDAAALIEGGISEVHLSAGNNEITTVVTDQLGKNPREYKLSIQRSIPLLSVLEIKMEKNSEKIILVPEFIPETTVYSVTIPYKTDKLKINAALIDKDIAAGASVEIITETEVELPVGTTGKVIRITYDDGKTFDYRVDITREEKDKFTFDIFGISFIPGWNITPSASFYTAGFGFKLNGGMTLRIAEDSTVNDALRPLRVGLGAHLHGGAGNYLSILSGAGYLSAEYMFKTANLLPDQWYFPKTIIPRLETGAGYYGIDYTEGTYIEGAAFYVSPGLRTDFIFPALPNIDFGIDLSYTAYIGPVTVTYFSLGVSVSFE